MLVNKKKSCFNVFIPDSQNLDWVVFDMMTLAAIQLDLELLMAGCAARKMSKIYLICLH